MAAQSLARLYLDGGDYKKAESIIEQGLEMRPGDPALLLLKGRTLVDLGRLAEALALLSPLPLANPERFFDPDLAYDLRICSEWPYALIGLIEFRQGRFQAAHDAYRAAAAAAPDVDHYPIKAALAAARAGTSARASADITVSGEFDG
jgi:tetratricopeptide (TPR) repeat protein